MSHYNIITTKVVRHYNIILRITTFLNEDTSFFYITFCAFRHRQNGGATTRAIQFVHAQSVPKQRSLRRYGRLPQRNGCISQTVARLGR